MRHNEFEILIQKSLDGEIGEEEDRILQLHLSDCYHCRQLYNELVQMEHTLDELIEFYPRRDFDTRVLKSLGFYRSLVWARAAMILIGSWFASFLFWIFSPITKGVFGRVLTSVPAIVRLFGKIQYVLSTLERALMPLAKNPLNFTLPIIGIIFSIGFMYLFAKTIRKEVLCRAY